MIDDTLTHLQSLDPRLAPFVWHFVAGWRRRGVPLALISGRRDAERNREVGGATHSLHLDGLAFDIAIWWEPYGDFLPRDWIPFGWWEALARPWEEMGGRWGGRFQSPDVNHFDTGRPTIEA